MIMELTDRQRVERETFDRLVQEKTRGRSLLVPIDKPSFADYNGDLFFGAIKKMNFKGKRLLEIGCGSGEIATWFALNGARSVTGVDISEESIRIAQHRANENNVEECAAFIACPGESIPVPDGSFDIIFINVALHHLELSAALKECARLLVNGGIFVAVEPLVRSSLVQNIRESRMFQVIYPVRRESITENILSMDDIALIKTAFGNLELNPYRVFSPFVYKLKKFFDFLSRIFFFNTHDPEVRKQQCNRLLQNFDKIMMRTMPFMAFASRYSILVAHKR